MTATTPETSGSPTKSRLPLRFSLRLLLLAVTAFAIGFPIWYRWPYEEEQVVWAKDARGKDDYTKPPDMRVVKTWRRNWGSGLVQDSEERKYCQDVLYELKTWRDGRLDGPYRSFHFPRGGIRVAGQFVAGAKDGLWTHTDTGENILARAEYRQGQIFHVLSRNRYGNPSWREFRFKDWPQHFMVQVNDNRIEDRLAQLVANGTIRDPNLVEALSSTTEIEIPEMPLKDALDLLSMHHSISVSLDPHEVDPSLIIGGEMTGIPLSTALAVLASEHDLTCDFRFGRVWITSQWDVSDWHDPTGVTVIVPPINSPLARVWDKQVRLETDGTPLVHVIEYWKKLPELRGLDIDTSKLGSADAERSNRVVSMVLGVPFKDLLGMVLYQTRCRCKLEGETLVILPPEKE